MREKQQEIENIKVSYENQLMRFEDAYEKKTKIEHTEMLSKINDLHKVKVEKLKSRIKSLENDFFNKSTELDKASKQITDLMRELRSKSEETDWS